VERGFVGTDINLVNEYLDEIVKRYFDGYSVNEAIQEVKSYGRAKAETVQANNKKQLQSYCSRSG
jgi:hypothetical protein